jgi:hypothetical protein
VPSRARSLLVLAALLTLVATAALRFGARASDAAVSTTLHATVGPAFDISLTFDDGSAVGALPAGSYRVLVSDITTDHNFHLLGPGVDEATDVDFKGLTTWNVTFRADSRYQFICDVHADSMFGHFDAGAVSDSVGGGGSSGGGSSGGGGGGNVVSPAHVTTLATLTAGVDSAGKPKLTLKSKTVKTLKAGRYKLVVTDPSKSSAVMLVRSGGKATTLTGVAFSGHKTIGVTLAAGQWKLYASSRPSSAIAVRVTSA